MRRVTLLLLAVVAAGVLIWPCERTAPPRIDNAPATDPGPAEFAALHPARRSPMAAEAFLIPDGVQLTDAELRRTFVLPDGTRARALNGVEDTSRLRWPAYRPKAPIVEIQRGPLHDYYVHADGSKSTTVLARDPATGALAASALVIAPPGAIEHALDLELGPDARTR